MPTLAFILERSYVRNAIDMVPDDSRRILNRPALSGEVETQAMREEFTARLIMELHKKIEAGANAMPSVAIPADPVRRKAWASETAKERGWL